MVDLLRDLQKRHDLTYLFISHDLRVVAALASRLMVMRNGKVVEEGPAAELFANPEERLHARAVRRRLQAGDRARGRGRAIGSPRPRARARHADVRDPARHHRLGSARAGTSASARSRRSATSGCGRIAPAIRPTSPMPASGSRRTACSPTIRNLKAMFSLGAGVDTSCRRSGAAGRAGRPRRRSRPHHADDRIRRAARADASSPPAALRRAAARAHAGTTTSSRPASDVAVGVMGLGVLGRDAARRAAAARLPGRRLEPHAEDASPGIETFHGADRARRRSCAAPKSWSACCRRRRRPRGILNLDSFRQAQARRRAAAAPI